MEEWQIPANDDKRQGGHLTVLAQRIKWWHWLLLLTLLAVLACLGYMSMQRHRGRIYLVSAMNCSKSLHLVMMDFEQDYGSFPSNQTAATDEKLRHFHGGFSNDYLGQLIAGGYIQSEMIFYGLDLNQPYKADNVISPEAEILKRNECGFSYVMAQIGGTVRSFSSSDDGRIPFLVLPLASADGAFVNSDDWSYGMYLCVDGTAHQEPLRETDHKISLPNGKTLFDTGIGTCWGTDKKPLVLLPER